MFEVNEILNDDGKPVKLTDREYRQATVAGEMLNSLGYDINITTLTAINKRVSEQKFFQVEPAEFLPVTVGEGTWSSEILTYRSYALGGDFEDGVINTGSGNSRLARTDAGIDSITVPVINWAETIDWSIFDLQMASKSGNWDLISAKEEARKKRWDLGIQKVAFLGMKSDPNVYGLLTQPDVTANTSLITGYINAMNATTFNTLIGSIIGDYQSNNAFTAMPTHFIIPQLDYNGLANFVDPTFPIKTKLEILLDVFRTITRNPNFKILPLAYADEVNNATISGLNKNRYTLLNFDPASIRMDIPLDYTSTMANTLNGLQFQNSGYGQFTGARAYRPLEMLYFDFAV